MTTMIPDAPEMWTPLLFSIEPSMLIKCESSLRLMNIVRQNTFM